MGGNRRGPAQGSGDGDRRKKLIDALVWQLDWGEVAEKILSAASANGQAPPPLPFLENRPELFDWLDFEWRAFWDLSTDRSVGFGTGPIPWSAIDRYAQRHDVGEDFDQFCLLIRKMDEAYREHSEEMNSKTECK